ncbi:hypothetical protein Gotur_021825, partial [Gossypium turneri]
MGIVRVLHYGYYHSRRWCCRCCSCLFSWKGPNISPLSSS